MTSAATEGSLSMSEIIRFTYQDTHYRLKIPQILNLSDYDYLKVLYYIMNQESYLNVHECLKAINDAADQEYTKQINDKAVSRDLVKFEKHMLWTRYLMLRYPDPASTPGYIKRPEITAGCRAAYREILQKTEEMLLNYYGIIFQAYQNKTGFAGTAYTLARFMAAGDEETERRLNDIREQERRYCS